MALAGAGGFRYSGEVTSRGAALLGFGLVAALLLVGTGLSVSGCRRGAESPAAAQDRLAEAVAARDPRKLYAALDLGTRWSWMSIRRAHREAYDIILSNFPEGPDREQRIQRFEAAALAEGEAELFAEQLPPDRLEALARQLAAAEPEAMKVAGDAATVPAGEGPPLVFRRGPGNDGWGFAGFAAEAEEKKRRAAVDLELIRTSAADFERAATRAGK